MRELYKCGVAHAFKIATSSVESTAFIILGKVRFLRWLLMTAYSCPCGAPTVPGANVDAEAYQQPPKYLAIHEFDNPDPTSTEEWKEATSTPWRNKVVEGAQRVERRVLKVYKNF